MTFQFSPNATINHDPAITEQFYPEYDGLKMQVLTTGTGETEHDVFGIVKLSDCTDAQVESIREFREIANQSEMDLLELCSDSLTDADLDYEQYGIVSCYIHEIVTDDPKITDEITTEFSRRITMWSEHPEIEGRNWTCADYLDNARESAERFLTINQ